MDPNGSGNHLKRPRPNSLDDEPNRPPPGQRGVYPSQGSGSSYSVVAQRRFTGGQLRARVEDSNAVQSSSHSWNGPAVWLPPPSDDLTLSSLSTDAWPLLDPFPNNFSLALSIPNGPSLARSDISLSPSTLNLEWLMPTMPRTQSASTGLVLSDSEPLTSFHSTQPSWLPCQTYVSGGTNIENNGVLNFYHQTLPAPADPCLSQLQQHAAADAIHTSFAVDIQGMCMPGTRAFTLQHLQSLVTSVESNDPDVIWMHGPAGAGKSAIMRTLASSLDEQGVLLGSFFFFRSDAERNTSARFLPTLALQSFTSLPATQPHIRNAIQTYPTIFSQSIRYQLHRLFETPLELAAADEPKWTAQSPLVLIIDGLDECADTTRQVEIIKAMHQLASTIRSSTNRRVKVLIASRPEMAIKNEFERNRDSTTFIELDPSDANIDLYYDTQLDKIRRDHNLPESWPSRKQIKWLKKTTSGQYSFAHVSMGFLAGGDPAGRLKMLVAGVVTHGLEPFDALDALYATVFHQIPPEMADKALILLRFWLLNPNLAFDEHDKAVERVLSLPLGFPSCLLAFLPSIFHLENGQYLPHHASLGDFLGDPLRSAKYSLFLDVEALSAIVVDGLLDLCTRIPPPIDEETNEAWFNLYEHLDMFVRYFEFFSDYTLLPNMVAALDRLPLSLPIMDLYAFGYCNYLLSTLYDHLQDQDHPLASDTSHRRTIRGLLDQIHSIQQHRFATYEAIEAGGDSGLGLFGLLLVFVSTREDCVLLKGSSIERQCTRRLEEIVGHLIRVHEDIHHTEQNVDSEEPLSLRALCHQLLTIKSLAHNWLPQNSYLLYWPLSLWGLFSIPAEDTPPQMLHCLPRAVGMFFDLPSQDTQIRRLISEFISCRDHATLQLNCGRCASNLEQVQTSVIYAAVQFLSSDYDKIFSDERLGCPIDAPTFIRCYNALKSARDHDHDKGEIYWNMSNFAGNIFRRSLREEPEGVDTPTVGELRTIISGFHDMKDNHNPRNAEYSPRNSCWICGNGQTPCSPSYDSETDVDSDGEPVQMFCCPPNTPHPVHGVPNPHPVIKPTALQWRSVRRIPSRGGGAPGCRRR